MVESARAFSLSHEGRGDRSRLFSGVDARLGIPLSPRGTAVRGMIHCDAGACPAKSARSSYFLVVETQEVERPSMRYCDSIFGHLLKPISRRWFEGVVVRHNADAYDKAFRSWDHLTLLVFAQLGGIGSLRGL